MGLDEFLEDAGEVIGDGVSNLVDKVGDVASDVGEWMSDVGESLGLTSNPESELGETDDPRELLHGDVETLGEATSHCRDFATAFDRTADALTRIDLGTWRGEAADAFHEAFGQTPKRWRDAADAFDQAASAWDGFQHTVSWAQGQAGLAIDLYNKGTQASEQAREQYDRDVDTYNREIAAANAGNGPPPAPPAPFSDPGTAKIDEAREILNRARQQRDSAADDAARTIRAATDLAPPLPSLVSRLWDDATDAFDMTVDASHSMLGGVLEVGEETLKFIRGINPTDPYNITHPAEFLAGVATTASGMVHAATHPIETLKAVIGSDWDKDPFHNIGRLTAEVLGTKGAGAGLKALRHGDAPHDRTPDGHERPAPQLHDEASRLARIEKYGQPDPEADWIDRTLHDYEEHRGLTREDSDTVQRLIGDSSPTGSNGKNYDEWIAEYGSGRKIPGTDLDELKYPTAESGHPNGFRSLADMKADWIEPGQLIDRFGGTAGNYLSPQGASWESRAIPPHAQNVPYHVYEVVRPIPTHSGPAAAWFDQPGGAHQYFLGKNIDVEDLLEYGYIKEVTHEYR